MNRGTTESVDYDLFDYKHFDESALSLDEAVKKAKSLRSQSAGEFIYRVVPVDDDLMEYRIQVLRTETLYAELLSRVARLWSRVLHSSR